MEIVNARASEWAGAALGCVRFWPRVIGTLCGGEAPPRDVGGAGTTKTISTAAPALTPGSLSPTIDVGDLSGG